MKQTISVYMQDSNKLISFLKSTKIIVFEKSDVWREVKTIPLPESYSTNPAELRRQISIIINELVGCNIIAGLELIGIPYCVFDSNGFSIFSISKLNDKVLDGIIADIEDTDLLAISKNEIINNAIPVETEISGVYYLDLVMLQRECPEISSKKALKDFLTSTPFIELQLLCNHIPPWLENFDYDIASRRTNYDNILATITKKCVRRV